MTSLDIALESSNDVNGDASSSSVTEDGTPSSQLDANADITHVMAESSDSETDLIRGGKESLDGSIYIDLARAHNDQLSPEPADVIDDQNTGSIDAAESSSVNEDSSSHDDTNRSSDVTGNDEADELHQIESDVVVSTITSTQLTPEDEAAATATANATNSSPQIESNENPNNQQTNSTTTDTAELTEDEEEEDPDNQTPKILVDYASKVSGAQILEKSPSLKGTSNLLTENTDRYAIAPCLDKKYVVIGLSEDILVKIVKLSNYERYSSHVKEFTILASQEYPVKEWTDLGTYTALSKSGEQTFELKQAAWARYLKFKFLSHYGVEHYCTVSQIKVHGSTMLQGFHEQWIESEKEGLDGGNNGEDGEDGEDGVVGDQDGDIDGSEIDNGDGEDGDLGDSEIQHERGVGMDASEETGVNAEVQVGLVEPGAALDLENGRADTDGQDIITEQQSSEQSINRSESDVTVDQREGTNQEVLIDQDSETVAASLSNAEESNDLDNTNENDENNALAEHDGSDISTVDITEKNKEAVTSELSDEDTTQTANVDQKHDNKDMQSTDESTNAKADADETESDVTTASQSHSHAKSDNESNVTLHGVADAVKAVVAHVTDELMHVKEAVQSGDAVSGIKKIIRTTIGTEEGGTTELDAVDVVSHTAEKNAISTEQDSMHLDNVENEAVVKPLAISQEQQIQTDNEIAVNRSESQNTTLVSDETANCTANATQTALDKDTDNATKTIDADENATQLDSNEHAADNRTQAAGSSSANKTKSATSKTETAGTPKKNKTTTDTSTQTKASTLKVEPTVTLPRKRDAIKSIDDTVKQLLSRYPSASCIKDLDFHAFKAKSLVANPTLGAIGAGGAKMEPIFQKITSEIKSVQTTQHQYEQYISAIMACYDKVLGDVANDMNTMENKFESRLTVLEMMLLERSDRRRRNSPSLFGMTVPLNFRLPAVAALLPFTANLDSPDETLICLGVTFFFMLVWLIVGRSRARRTGASRAANSATASTMSPCKQTSEDESQTDNGDGITSQPRNTSHNGISHDKQTCEDESQSSDSNGVYPQPIQNSEFHPLNLPSEITHQISCEESVGSVPSLPRSEPTGSSIHSPVKESRGRFRIRKRTKSDGVRTPR